MLPLLRWWKHFQAFFLLCLFFFSSEGLNFADTSPSTTENGVEIKHSNNIPNDSLRMPQLESSKIAATSFSSSSLATESLESMYSSSSFLSADATSTLTHTQSQYASSETMNSSHLLLLPTSDDSIPSTFNSDIAYHSTWNVLDSMPSFENKTPLNSETISNALQNSNLESFPDYVLSLSSETVHSTEYVSHFHTPLMSLLVEPPSSVTWNTEHFFTTSSLHHVAQSLTTTTISSNNEFAIPTNHVPTTTTDQQQDHHKKLLMLVLRAEDCARFSKTDFEKMLSKLMAKFGFNDVIPEVSNARCYSHLNINVTVGEGPTPTLRFLPNLDGRNNYTVDVLNRTFRIVKLEKVDLRLEKTSPTKSSNVSSSIITAVASHESMAYIGVGVSFGLLLVVCVFLCCMKCCLGKPAKRYGMPKGGCTNHVRLRPEDYTLTPIPRPTSLYVDYYRGSGTGDIYSTTSAGSIASTTPTVEQGVVQPFDTSIVPLEDSSNQLPLDSPRDPSIESVPVQQSDLKTFNIHSLSGKAFRTTDSKEQLNPKAHPRSRVDAKPGGGVANPTFQRY